MLPGPVFFVELLTTARRGRYYAMRFAVGLVLLAVFALSYRVYFGHKIDRGQTDFAPGEMSEFSMRCFEWFMMTQAGMILAITPALVAGTIADEKQRKTIHYLLASQLSGAEIVLGKLFARLLHVGNFVALGLPIVCSLGLFGGVGMENVALAYALTASFAFFIASLAIFFSTYSATARAAIIRTYLTLILFIALPLVAALVSGLWPVTAEWITPMIAAANPFANWIDLAAGARVGSAGVDWERMMLAQCVYGVLLVTWAALRLRAVAARSEKRQKVELRIDDRGQWRWRALPRPACGDDAMLWKERYTSRVGGFAKLVGLLHNLFWVVLVGCWAFELGRSSLVELQREGYGSNMPTASKLGGPGAGRERRAYLEFTQGVSAVLVGLWMLGAAATAAGSISLEREDDTWISLLSTPLGSREILRAKAFGAIMRFRWLGYVLLTIWTVGLAIGALHPLGYLLSLIQISLFVGFAAALGLRVSLRSPTTSRALGLTVAVLVFVNAGYLLALLPLQLERLSPYMGACAPYAMTRSLLSYDDVAGLFSISRIVPLWRWNDGLLPAVFTALAVYGLGTLLLAFDSFRLFDAVADRPGASPIEA